MRRPSILGAWLLAALTAGACASSTGVVQGPAATAPPTTTRTPPSRAPSSEATRDLLDAELALSRGDLKGATKNLRDAIVHDDGSPYLQERLAEVLLASDNADGALVAANAALHLNDHSVDAWRLRGQAKLQSGDRSGARSDFEHALTLAPGERQTSALLADLLVDAGDVDAAEHVVTALMEREPGSVDGFITLARVLAERGDSERAFAHLRSALTRNPSSTDALALKLDLLRALGRDREALVVVRALAAELGDSPRLRAELVASAVLASDTTDAKTMARAWLDDDDSEGVRITIADGYERAGAREDAERALTSSRASPRLIAERARLRLAAHDPTGAAALTCHAQAGSDRRAQLLHVVVCARALASLGRTGEAQVVLQGALQKAPEPTVVLDELATLAESAGLQAAAVDAPALVRVVDDARRAHADAAATVRAARVRESTGDVVGARDVLESALRETPSDPVLLLALAHQLERHGEALAAVALAERVLAVDVTHNDRSHNDGDTLNFIAFTLAEAHARLDDAHKHAWRAVLLDPTNGSVIDTLGWVQVQEGSLDDAIATLRRALVLSPDEGEIEFHLATALHSNHHDDEARRFVQRALVHLSAHDDARVRAEDLALALGVATIPSTSPRAAPREHL